MNVYVEYHQATDTEENPYKWSQCDKCFTTVDYLITHMLIHRGEKPEMQSL